MILSLSVSLSLSLSLSSSLYVSLPLYMSPSLSLWVALPPALPTDEGPPLPCMKLRVTVCCEPSKCSPLPSSLSLSLSSLSILHAITAGALSLQSLSAEEHEAGVVHRPPYPPHPPPPLTPLTLILFSLTSLLLQAVVLEEPLLPVGHSACGLVRVHKPPSGHIPVTKQRHST